MSRVGDLLLTRAWSLRAVLTGRSLLRSSRLDLAAPYHPTDACSTRGVDRIARGLLHDRLQDRLAVLHLDFEVDALADVLQTEPLARVAQALGKIV